MPPATYAIDVVYQNMGSVSQNRNFQELLNDAAERHYGAQGDLRNLSQTAIKSTWRFSDKYMALNALRDIMLSYREVVGSTIRRLPE